MNSEQLAKIFEPFKQADSSITRRYGGTGIGLSLSKRLAKLLGGSLQASSTPGEGSEFELKITAGNIQAVPLVNDYEQIAEQTVRIGTETANEVKLQGTVLLAEDNETNQQLLSLYLAKMGVAVTLAENGEKALAYASNQDYDLILMDMQMPVMSGIDTVKQLRQRGYAKPIVALTANATHLDRSQCLEAGCDDFVTKPVMRDRFYRTVARYLQPAAAEAVAKEPLVSSLLEQSPEFAGIVKQFIDELPEIIHTLNSAYQENDWNLLSDEVHKLKGMGGGVGFPQFTEL